MAELSVLIPARNERWLARTVADVLAHSSPATEVIAVCDGAWPDSPLPDQPRLQVIYVPEAIGQRAAVNLAARVSTARYVMKLDAHCAVSPGFDTALLRAGELLGPDVTQIPRMYNLHAFDWACRRCGFRTYQGGTPTRCERMTKGVRCPGREFTLVEVWRQKPSPTTDFARFEHDLHFQYWRSRMEGGRKVGGYETRAAAAAVYPEVLSSIGACFVMRRDRFWALGGLDEAHGSWGQFGTEISCKSWLSGGRQVLNRGAWFAHLFRTQHGFGFPYPNSGSAQEAARAYSRQLWWTNSWAGQTRPLAWLLEHFKPIPGWHAPSDAEIRQGAPGGDVAAARTDRLDRLHAVEAAGAAFRRPTVTVADPVGPAPAAPGDRVGFLYYTDGRLADPVRGAVVRQLLRATHDAAPAQQQCLIEMIVLDETGRGVSGGEYNDRWRVHITPVRGRRGPLAMFRQILTGLERLRVLGVTTVFHVEHDVLYPAAHFAFRPARRDTVYYNDHVWKVDVATGRALSYRVNQTSGLCADRALLEAHYRARVDLVERQGFSMRMGYEPDTRQRRHGGVDDLAVATWSSTVPLVDLRHGGNLTPSRWRKDQFRNQKYTRGWTEADAVPGWGQTRGRVAAFLEEVTRGTDRAATL